MLSTGFEPAYRIILLLVLFLPEVIEFLLAKSWRNWSGNLKFNSLHLSIRFHPFVRLKVR